MEGQIRISFAKSGLDKEDAHVVSTARSRSSLSKNARGIDSQEASRAVS